MCGGGHAIPEKVVSFKWFDERIPYCWGLYLFSFGWIALQILFHRVSGYHFVKVAFR